MAKALIRARRLLSLFWSTAIAAEMEYRLNFVFALLTSIINLIGGLYGIWLVFRARQSLGGWSWPEALLVFGCYTILKGLTTTFLNPNLSKIVQLVQSGGLDFVLLKPVDAQFWLSFRTLSLWGLPDLLLGLGIIVFAQRELGPPAIEAALVASLIFIAGTLTLYGLWFILATCSIWFVRVANVTEVLRHLMEAGRFPVSAYPASWQLIFSVIVPVAFMTSLPVEALLGRAAWSKVALAFSLALVSVTISRWFWRFAISSYTSASS